MNWMKKTLAIASVCTLLLTGCGANQTNETNNALEIKPTPAPSNAPQQNLQLLTVEKMQEIETAWLAANNSQMIWYSEALGAPADGIRYYGNYNGYDILFEPTNQEVITKVEIAGVSFCHNNSFALYVYRDGTFVNISDAFANGLITEEDLTEAAKLHLTYENRLFQQFLPGTDNDVIEAMKTAFLEQFIHEEGRTTAELSVIYYGEYDGAHVGFINGILFYTQAFTSETVGNVTFHYKTGQKLLVYYDGELMRLGEAYDRGILSDDAVVSLHKAYNGDSGNITE